MNVTLDHIEDIALHIKTFWFKSDEPIRFVAGQFTAIQLALERPDERGTRHWFTISSAPTEPLLGITTKFTPAKGSTFKHALQALRPGDKLNLLNPMGDFVLPQDKTIPLIFIAGGIGITPPRSIIKWLQDTGEQRKVHLVYSVRSVEEMAYRDLFESYPLRFTPIVTQPDASWRGETGLLTAKKILALAGDDPRTLMYLSGPEPMVETFVTDLLALGFPRHRLVTDYFPGYKTI